MRMGQLETVPALDRPDLLAPAVAAALAALDGKLPADAIGVAEIDPELAVLKGIKNGGWATVTTSVGEIEARALVSGRMRPLRLGRGQRVHQIGIPYNYGTLGYTSGDVAGDLVPIAMDPNVSIHEAKTITCTIRPGRRAAYTTDVVDQPVPAEQHTTAGQSTAHGIDRGR